MSLPLTPSDGHSSNQDSAPVYSDREVSFRAHRPTLRLKLLATVAVLAIATFSILPNYFTGGWIWNAPAALPQASQLNRLQAEGLTLPGWQTLEQQTVSISGSKWSVQAIQPDLGAAEVEGSDGEGSTPVLNTGSDRPVLVMLRPQVWHLEQPQVEWMDINGAQRWTADHHERIFLSRDVGDDSVLAGLHLNSGLSDRSISFSARYFRGWSRQQTYAVVQWYAWTTGGSPAVSQWFWVDQWKQLRDRQRMPWVAVSVLVPIKPLGNIDTVRTIAESLSRTIQSTLVGDVFTESS